MAAKYFIEIATSFKSCSHLFGQFFLFNCKTNHSHFVTYLVFNTTAFPLSVLENFITSLIVFWDLRELSIILLSFKNLIIISNIYLLTWVYRQQFQCKSVATTQKSKLILLCQRMLLQLIFFS